MYSFRILKRNNMKIKLTILLTVLLAISHFFYSCEDIIETDLTKKWVYVVAPQDFSISTLVTPTLKWKEVKGADSYNLQISMMTDTTYLKLQEFIVDTNVRSTQYTCTLKPGCYKWEIYAKNSGSQTGLSRFHFQIDSSSNLSKQKVVLLSPINNRTTDTLKQIFKWEALPAATTYNFEIFKSGSNVAEAYVKIAAPTNTYTYTFPASGGVYSWSVAATNGASSTLPSTFKIVIDTSGVPVPNLISPVNDTLTLTGNYVPIKWSSVKNATAYVLQVTQNTSLPVSQMDTVTTIETPLVTFYNYYNAVTKVKYYWRVKAIREKREGNFSNWVVFKRN
jgi:hypothetical protein